MTNIYQKNNHFHITTGEIWDLESVQDAMRDIIAPYSVSKGNCNIVLDLSQLSERHIYNKPFALSLKRFVDNIYGVKMAILVVPDENQREALSRIMDRLIEKSLSKTAAWSMTANYQSAQLSVTRGE